MLQFIPEYHCIEEGSDIHSVVCVLCQVVQYGEGVLADGLLEGGAHEPI